MRISKQPLGLLAAAFSLWLPLADVCGQAEPPAQTQTQPIRIGLIATDHRKQRVVDLRREEIQLTEDGEPREITYFAHDIKPSLYTIALDTSGSFKTLLPACVSIAKAFIENNRPEDETMLVRFVNSDKIERMQDFTNDKSKLLDALKSIYVDEGQTAVIDAVYISADATAAYQPDKVDKRRAVVLFTDGEDRISYYTEDQLMKLLRELDVQIFIIGIVKELNEQRGLTRPSPREKAEKLLNRVAAETGGRAFFPKDIPELIEAAKQINQDLESRYVIGFERQNKQGEKGFRKFHVSIKRAGEEKLVAITRPGYWVGPRKTERKNDGKDKDKK